MRNIQIDTFPSLTFHRYVDDMFISIQFPSTENYETIGMKMLELSTRIGAFLSSSLGLCLNPLKTRLNIVATEAEINKLIEESQLVSFYQPLPEEGGEAPQATLKPAITVLNSMKNRFRETGFIGKIATNDDLALKECFHKVVIKYTQSEEAKIKLETVFQDWNAALIPKSMSVLIFLIS